MRLLGQNPVHQSNKIHVISNDSIDNLKRL